MFWTGAEVRHTSYDQLLPQSLRVAQVGFGVLASLPDSKEVFPLLGRPHDSLDSKSKEHVSRIDAETAS
jgi:hypothetical protein